MSDKTQARMNITWQGGNADLPKSVPFEASDHALRIWASESIQAGAVPGMQGKVNLDNHVVDRFPASAIMPYARIFLRPSTPFG